MRSNATKRSKYKITTVEQAKTVSKNYLKSIELEKAVDFGLPEIDDRYHIWRVPIKSKSNDAYWAERMEQRKNEKQVQYQKYQL
jgi:hypothetical protein